MSRRRRFLRREPRLHQCLVCQGDYVVPVSIESIDDESSRLLTRCAQCETYREMVVGRKQLSAYMAQQQRGMEAIAGRLIEIDRERMRAQVDAFASAARLDLFDAADFDRRASD